MNIKKHIKQAICFLALGCGATVNLQAQEAVKAPVMGWSSWNHFHVDISEQMIREQADALLSSGMYDAGYRYINVDDGFFGGRDGDGNLLTSQEKFPSGMKALADYIHSKGLKAGLYSDAGNNTCGFVYDDDAFGEGVGMYGHIDQDVDLFFNQWGYDFIKVDWCGGERMGLDEQTEYTKIIKAVKGINPNIVFNICRWEFPGEWALGIADSWRISSDIRANFSSILRIIDLNVDLHQYASAGHYNDMDMLQVGRGMSFDEDKTHFSMWCMLNSPLLAGNDLRDMSEQTIRILTNKELIALNQDKAFKQAQRVEKEDSLEIWKKPLYAEDGKQAFALAIMNRGGKELSYRLDPTKQGITAQAKLRDLWAHEDLVDAAKNGLDLTIPKHGIVVLRIEQ